MADDPSPPGPPGNPTFALAELVRRAMRTSYGMIARESVAGFESAATLEAVVELLIKNGLVDPAELATLREQAVQRLGAARSETWDGPWLTMVTEQDVAQPETIVDCATRHPHCRASCCVFYRVVLTEHEVRRAQLLWDLGAPYSLPRTPTGHCVNLDQQTLSCAVWETRPYVCRHYSCSNDREIWQDFENMVPTERVRSMSRIKSRGRALEKGPKDE